jgi:hypothetical protein
LTALEGPSAQPPPLIALDEIPLECRAEPLGVIVDDLKARDNPAPPLNLRSFTTKHR